MTSPAPKSNTPAPKSKKLTFWLLAGRIFFGVVAIAGVVIVLLAPSKAVMDVGYVVGVAGSILLIGLLAWDQLSAGIRRAPTQAPDDFSKRNYLPPS